MKINFTYLAIAACCGLQFSCDKSSERIPLYPIARITAFERDSLKTDLTYNSQDVVTALHSYVYGRPVSSASITYKPDGIVCTNMNGVDYRITWDNTVGGSRAREITATRGGSLYYRIEYFYDVEGRLHQADLHGIETNVAYMIYEYDSDKIRINDNGSRYEIELSGEDNTGYVCNVMAFAPARYTNTYVINPDLYYLNIYGTPALKLPEGENVSRAENNRLSQVGKYRYYY